MQKRILAILSPIIFLGCTNSSYPTNNIPPKHTVVKEKSTTKQLFKKDNHRYDKRYQNFDYDRLGYSSSNGLYYGYFDDMGYFYNNIYFTYDDEYTYEDRYDRKGHFSPDIEQIRVYIYHDNNDWNKKHQYKKQNQIVGQYLYYEINPRPKFRVYHRPESGPSYQNSIKKNFK